MSFCPDNICLECWAVVMPSNKHLGLVIREGTSPESWHLILLSPPLILSWTCGTNSFLTILTSFEGDDPYKVLHFSSTVSTNSLLGLYTVAGHLYSPLVYKVTIYQSQVKARILQLKQEQPTVQKLVELTLFPCHFN